LCCRKNELFENDDSFCFSCRIHLPLIKSEEDLRTSLKGKIGLEQREVYSLLYFSKDSKTQEILHQIKYYNKSSLAIDMGKRLANKYKEDIRSDDILIPVPLHPRRLHERGYNQALKIAEGVREISGATIDNQLIKRVLYHKSQTIKSKVEREEVKEKTYQLNRKILSSELTRRMILVDDVITTGSTIHGCIRILHETGLKNISVATVAIAI
jgi:ComF family protein